MHMTKMNRLHIFVEKIGIKQHRMDRFAQHFFPFKKHNESWFFHSQLALSESVLIDVNTKDQIYMIWEQQMQDVMGAIKVFSNIGSGEF